MASQIIIGFAVEGSTDERFMEGVIQRTFEDIALECTGQIEILPIRYIRKKNGSFVNIVKEYAIESNKIGIMILCIHCDADSSNDINVFENKINPAFSNVYLSEGDICKNLVPVVPVQMTEAWMLADKDLLKEEIGTNMTNLELGINRPPETISDPKKTIEESIRITRKSMSRRKRGDLTIGELYRPLGQKIPLDKLGNLNSYNKFREAVKEAYRKLNYLP